MNRLNAFFFLLFGVALATQAAAQTITATDGAPGDAFGRAVASDGNIIVVGAPGVDVNGHSGQGAAYVFVRSRGEWLELAKLTAGDGAPYDRFGSAVAVSGNTIVIGAPYARAGDETGAGAVYVFGRRFGLWQQLAKLTASDARGGAEFGFSVATDGATIVAGSPSAHVNFGPPGNFLQGAAYVYSKQGSRWNEDMKLSASDASRWYLFGWSVAISNRGIVIGSPGRRDYAGGAYVFERIGRVWQETMLLTPGSASRGRHIGYAVAAHGNRLAVGVPYGSIPETLVSGVVHAYRRTFKLQHYSRMVASDWTGGAWFGGALSMSGSRLAVGAPHVGEAYLFALDDAGEWQEAANFLPVHSGSQFGESVAVAATVLAIGHGNAVVDGDASRGAVLIYAIN